VDLRKTPLVELTETGLRTSGAEYEFDAIVFATGFDAMTGALTAVDIRGRDGMLLADEWRQGPRTYLGIGVAGFPNLFTVTGPLSPSVLSNMVVSIEQHVEWITDCIAHMQAAGYTLIEPTAEAEAGWGQHVAEVGAMSLFPRADSWYMGANVPGKARVFLPYLGGVGTYRELCDGVVAAGYQGFTLTTGADASGVS
jgi:cation diffusion facilitator CzcD-associated flavoprotein CzcO